MPKIRRPDPDRCLHCAIMRAISKFRPGELSAGDVVEALTHCIMEVRDSGPTEEIRREMDGYIVSEFDDLGLHLMLIEGHA